ncbi:hypothetical protein OPV22_007995 [Ensete ventricosum]|uniref:Uncharacterized protein n=1 Tax=Ensete ventricosum TaxID=4639 RepID=A0AAV8RFI2_ENSVE|nr:hypothetical protein OPV22_007995 [Ensete ventricosum]
MAGGEESSTLQIHLHESEDKADSSFEDSKPINTARDLVKETSSRSQRSLELLLQHLWLAANEMVVICADDEE